MSARTVPKEKLDELVSILQKKCEFNLIQAAKPNIDLKESHEYIQKKYHYEEVIQLINDVFKTNYPALKND